MVLISIKLRYKEVIYIKSFRPLTGIMVLIKSNRFKFISN